MAKPAGNADKGLVKAVWKATRAYRVDTKDTGNKAALESALAEVIGDLRPGAAVHAVKVAEAGIHNNPWQGKGNNQQFDAMVFLYALGNRDGVARAARGRLHPPPDNGFEAIVIAEPDGTGWKPAEVVEYGQSNVGSQLRQMAGQPDLKLTKVADPSAAQIAIPAGSFATHGDDLTHEETLAHLQEAKNVVIEGPPGTGKTRLALTVARALSDGDPDACRLENILKGRSIPDAKKQLSEAPVVWEFVQFHAAYSYEDFVRGLRTDPDAKGFSLRSEDGILPRMCQVAELRRGTPTLLIIDEINRCNLSNVLGESIFAIDRDWRDVEVDLQYEAPPDGQAGLVVPRDLLLLATMNTADRSIALLDFAIRRRFRFLYLAPSESALSGYYSGAKHRQTRVLELYRIVQQAVPEPDLRPGHSYLMVARADKLTDDQWAKELVGKLLYEVRPLLREYLEEGRDKVRSAQLGLPSGTVDLVADDDDTLRDPLIEWLTEADND